MRFRTVLLLGVVLVVAAVGFVFWRGTGPLSNPEGCQANVGSQRVYLSTEQAENATIIAALGVERGLPARAVSIALATAYQESKIRNLPAGDRDSIGIFQQRPSQGWGAPAQLRDPYYATAKFYDALQKIDGYQTMRITEAAQLVQRSGYPEAYEPHAPDARALASALTGFSLGGRFSCVVHDSGGGGTASEVQSLLTKSFGNSFAVERSGTRQDLLVQLSPTEEGRRLGWAAAQFLVGQAKAHHIVSVQFAGREWHSGKQSENGWTGADTQGTTLRVTLG